MTFFSRFYLYLKNSLLSVSSEHGTEENIQRYVNVGIIACAGMTAVVFMWAAFAHLSGAVIAPGFLVVESHLKKVQHPTGGVVAELNVKDGSIVRAGDVLLRLDPTSASTSLAIVTKALNELGGRRARLEAERDEKSQISFPEGLLSQGVSTEKIRTVEEELFLSHKLARQAQRDQLNERLAQLEEQVKGLQTQKELTDKQILLTDKQLVNVEYLYKKKLATLPRFSALQNEAISLKARHAQLISSIAELKGKIFETTLVKLQFEKDTKATILKELGEVEGRMEELLERKIAGEDQLERIDIRAPQDGVVHELNVHTVGGVIAPGEILMSIVPQADGLIIEAKISPDKIDQVRVDQSAFIRLSAFDQKKTPEFSGRVIHISGDLSKVPQTGEIYYTTRISLLDQPELKELKLVPGMPAEVFIKTGERSALSFLLKPLTDQFSRAFRER